MEKTEEVYLGNIIEEELASVLKGKTLQERMTPGSFYEVSQGINIIDIGYPLCACYVLNRCISRLSRQYCEIKVIALDAIEFEKGECSFDEIKKTFWGEDSELAQRADFLQGESCCVSEDTIVHLKNREITKRISGDWKIINSYAVDFARGKTENEMMNSDTGMEAYQEEYEDARQVFIDGVKTIILLEDKMREKTIIDKGGLEQNIIDKDWFENGIVIIESEHAMNQGTAFHIGNGKFVTCYHVIYNDNEAKVADDLEVYLANNVIKRYKVQVVESIEALDFALVKVEDWDHDEKLELDINKQIKVMDNVFVLGFPNYHMGDSIRIVEAQIASTRRYSGETLYGLDKVIYGGNSGGPIIAKENKKVIGIVMRGTKNAKTAIDDDFSGFLPISVLQTYDVLRLIN